MKRIFIFSTIFVLIMLFISNFVYASGINMNLTNSGNAGNTASNESTNTDTEDTSSAQTQTRRFCK